MSEIFALREERRVVLGKIADATITLISNICNYYRTKNPAMFSNTSKPNITLRTARNVYYSPSKNRIMFSFTHNLVTMLHECYHFLTYKEGISYTTHKLAFIEELEAAAFAIDEYERWINEYSKELLPLQLKLVELDDKIEGKM